MTDVVHELGVIARAQSSHIHSLLNELNYVSSDSEAYSYLEKQLDRQILIRDLIIDLIESVVEEPEEVE